jgi:diguanylate cyclase (GGDEF)-like protein/PAS domain S-box-containing protein
MSSPADGASLAQPSLAAGETARREETFEAFLEELFEDATALAMQISGASLAALSLVREGHHWFQSRGGVRIAETPRAIALCAEAAATSSPLILPDVARDRRFRDDSLFRGSIRFFAGIPLIDASGTAIGTLSVMDREPRQLTEAEIGFLRSLGRQVERALRLRLRAEELERAAGALEAEARLVQSAHRLQSDVIASAGQGIVVYDRALRHVMWNRAMERLTGFAASDVLGRNALQLFPQLRDQGIADLLERALAGETVTAPDVPFRAEGATGSVWLSGTYAPHRDASGAVVGAVGIVRDVTDRRRAEHLSSTVEPQFRTLVEQSLVGMYVAQDGRFRYANPRLAAVFGCTQNELLGLDSLLALVAEEDREAVLENIRRIEEERQTVRFTFRGIRKDGEPIEVEAHGTPAEVAGNSAVIGTLSDISDRKRVESRILEQAYNDPLTRLPNRTLFLERLELALAQARRHGRRLAVLYIDLDRFKLINDTRGHSTGDLLLQSLALRLKRRLRQADTLARVGGDEFVILMPDARASPEMSLVAQKLLAAVARPFQLGDQTLHVTASIGIATFPDDGQNGETLLRNADAAMYRAKELGRNNFQLCTPELTSKAVERLALQVGLRQALDRNEFALHYQPIVSLVTGRVVGLEALVRWEHPEQGLVMPTAFISAAEETGLIVPLGEWVLRAACQQVKKWHQTGLGDLRVAVNVSARQFREDSLVHMVGSALSEADLDPRHLEVEITESIAMESAEIVVGNLRLLRGMGVGIAIDDFGTGYSSLTYLKRYPVTALKIDRSFVADLPDSAADAGIVRAIVEMAHGTKLNVIAEGVETKDQFLLLQRHGCDEMQGYWVSPPLTSGGVDHLLGEELRLWAERA